VTRERGAYAPAYSAYKRERVKLIIAYGEGRQRIYDELKESVDIDVVNNLDDGLDIALQKMRGDDVVLFSPACASFDQFNNFEHRGEYFKELVNRL
jgi:UDP-N-acetylmuramoylalanine--D-glutamate ligase